MIDLEGPSSPPDINACRYGMTYICTLSHGLLLDASPRCNSTEARLMFSRCVWRSGTIPLNLRSDRGPEFKNILMEEYTALMGIHHRFGNPWRPMEQGLVETIHETTSTLMGMLVHDVLQAYPHDWG